VGIRIAREGLHELYLGLRKGLLNEDAEHLKDLFNENLRFMLFLSTIHLVGGVLASYSLGMGAYWIGKAIWVGTTIPSLWKPLFLASLGMNFSLFGHIGRSALYLSISQTKHSSLENQLRRQQPAPGLTVTPTPSISVTASASQAQPPSNSGAATASSPQ